MLLVEICGCSKAYRIVRTPSPARFSDHREQNQMKTLISNTLNPRLITQSSAPIFIFHFPSIHRTNPNFLSFSHPKRFSSLRSAAAAESPVYGGWDDPTLGDDSVRRGESNQLREFLNSLGIDDKKYVFVYLLGFVCALAISRVRVSSIVVFPACFIVFAIGFSIGALNGGRLSESSSIGIKKISKDENLRGSIEKLKKLVDKFNGFDSNIQKLKSNMNRCIRHNQISTGDLENYVGEIDSIGSFALDSRNVLQYCIDNMIIENQEIERNSNQNSNKRSKELDRNGFDWSHFIVGLFGEKSINSKPSKRKEVVKKDSSNVGVNSVRQDNISDDHSRNSISFGHVSKNPNHILEGSKKSKDEALDFEEDSYKTQKLRFVNNKPYSLNTNHKNDFETWVSSRDNLLDSLDFRVSLKHMKTESSFFQERTFRTLNGSQIWDENVISTDDSSQSPTVKDDMAFNEYLMESNGLLKQARECLRGRGDEVRAEDALYKSAKLLSRAVDMKPSSLLAVGQLGNTYLLHGEIKLKISRELRTLLTRNDPLLYEKWRELLEGIDDEIVCRDKITAFLFRVCEECEALLVEAGRKYKVALSIDGNDMRALYNWGLALSFRAQLIADIGPEAALDADKIFMAAIDKFDAMMAKSNVYAPDALYRWGTALQQRSRLRPRNSKEKVKLLQQAKRLYEDALDIDSGNLQVRDALSSCEYELDYRNY